MKQHKKTLLNKALIKACKKNKMVGSECKYKQYKNTLTSILRKAEINYYDELLRQSKSNLKKNLGYNKCYN